MIEDVFLGEIRIFAGTFAPEGWAQCNGQVLRLTQNTALFSIIGITYGGDGHSTFALPSMEGCAPIDVGQGAGLSKYVPGEEVGSSHVAIQTNQSGVHQHSLTATTAAATSGDPAGLVLAVGGWNDGQGASGSVESYSTKAPDTALSQALGPAGFTSPHNNVMPSLSLNFCIALQGVFPPRS